MAIVCGTDFSESAAQATAAATAIAARFAEDLWLVHVIELSFDAEPASMEAVRTYAELRLQEHAQRLQPRMPGRLHCVVLSGAAATALADFAEAQDARLIVVASQGRTASPLYRAGGTSERVAGSARVPVLVVRSAAPFLAWQRADRPLRVLIGIDPSASAETALRWLGALRKAGPCDVIVAHVYYSDTGSLRYGIPSRQAALESGPDVEQMLARDLEKQVGELPGTGEISFRAVRGLGRLGDHLLDVAETEAADLIVVGTHHKHGLTRLASVSSVALRFGHASVACVPAPDTGALTPRRIPRVERVLIATDFSEPSSRAVGYGYGLLSQHGGEVYLLHVAPATARDAGEDVAWASRLRALVPEGAAAMNIVTRTEIVHSDDVVQSVCQSAERLGADVICVASHGGSAIVRTLLGSVTEGVMKHSHVPVLVVQPLPR